MKKSVVIAVVVAVAASVFAAGGAKGVKNATGWRTGEYSREYDIARNLETFTAVYKRLETMYVDTLDPTETVGEGIRAMLRSLDPYTEYYPADETNELKTLLTGKYAGIGAVVRYDLLAKSVVIDEPYEGMPAAEVGLRKGDLVVSIDGEAMRGRPTSEVTSRLRGTPGSTFQLKVERIVPGKKKPETLKFKITRRAIQLPSVQYYGFIEPGVGYLLLTQFTEGCAAEARRAVVDMRRRGMKALVLDLRGNGGGSLSEAIDIVNMFIPKGVTLVTTKGRVPRANKEYCTEREPVDTLMPLAVLVDGSSASASEITAGSLQDLDRATVVGTRTYGKGLVQQTTELPHDGSMKLTVSKYYIPSGRCIQAINYKHSGGGYTEHIPDSLTREFRTKSGRVVRDGGGIKPDVEVRPDSLPNIAIYLCRGGLDSTEVVQRYVTDYILRHASIAPAAEFSLTDEDYAEFRRRVLESGFKYDRETERICDRLIEAAKFEGYYDGARAEFEALRTKLRHDLARELDAHRPVIQRLLEDEIVCAYYFQKGRAERNASQDPQVRAAEEVLKEQLK